MISSSLDMLEESLVKKIEIMKKIEEENDRQKEILKNYDEVDDKAFEETVDNKGELIDQLLLLDEGFQALFDKVKEELGDDKDSYRDQIKRMQDLIQEITGLSASIEANERRNKKLAESYFSAVRQKMNYSRQTSAAAFNYYKTMNNFKDIPPQFIDKQN
jgi:DNA repair exonuclease SbcCD ATPase subunit